MPFTQALEIEIYIRESNSKQLRKTQSTKPSSFDYASNSSVYVFEMPKQFYARFSLASPPINHQLLSLNAMLPTFAPPDSNVKEYENQKVSRCMSTVGSNENSDLSVAVMDSATRRVDADYYAI